MTGLKFINTDELKSVEIIQIKHKKMWMTPELEVLDSRKTNNIADPGTDESLDGGSYDHES